MRLVADIGGTNARLALSERRQIIDGSTRRYVNADWDSLLQELSLAYMPSAGIYLAGSVARSLMSVAAGPCMQAFERDASSLLHPDTPIWSINDDLAALTGCAKFEM